MKKDYEQIEEHPAFKIETNLNRTIDMTNTSIDTDQEFNTSQILPQQNNYYTPKNDYSRQYYNNDYGSQESSVAIGYDQSQLQQAYEHLQKNDLFGNTQIGDVQIYPKPKIDQQQFKKYVKFILGFFLVLCMIVFFWRNLSSLANDRDKDKANYLVKTHFDQYCTDFKKVYKEAEEYQRRLDIFKKNFMLITHQIGSVTMKLNQFADWTDDEYLDITGLRSSRVKFTPNNQDKSKDNLEPINWIDKQGVSPVRDISESHHQKTRCSAGYAAATVDTIESYYMIKHQFSIQFSVQQLIDCSSDSEVMKGMGFQEHHINYGCEGGYLVVAFMYADKFPLMRQTDYDYSGEQEKCLSQEQFIQKNLFTYKIPAITGVLKPNVFRIKKLLQRGPVATEIVANSPIFRYYSSGIIDDVALLGIQKNMTCAYGEQINQNLTMPSVNHAVSIVGWGYNETYDSEYFIIKNSFGTQWGEEGFARISTKTSQQLPYGTCGILSAIYQPYFKENKTKAI